MTFIFLSSFLCVIILMLLSCLFKHHFCCCGCRLLLLLLSTFNTTRSVARTCSANKQFYLFFCILLLCRFCSILSFNYRFMYHKFLLLFLLSLPFFYFFFLFLSSSFLLFLLPSLQINNLLLNFFLSLLCIIFFSCNQLLPHIFF